MRFVWMGTDWSMRQNLNTCGTDEVVCCKRVASGRRVAGAGYWLMLGVCSLSVLESCMKHWLYLFLCMVVRQCYGRRDLELGLYR